MIKIFYSIAISYLICGCQNALIAERPDHDQYNERTSFLIGKIQRMTDADRIESLVGESNSKIKKFCEENNYEEEDIKNVLKN